MRRPCATLTPALSLGLLFLASCARAPAPSAVAESTPVTLSATWTATPTLTSTLLPTPSETPTVTPFPTLTPTPSLTPTASPTPAVHRVGVRVVDGLGQFYDTETGAKFVPRGMNYARVDHIIDGGHWHSTFDPALYDPAGIDRALGAIESEGYNTVRVFIDCCSAPGQQVGDPHGGLSSAYLGKVVDFLERAKTRHLSVLLSVDLTPGEGGYNDPLWKAINPNFDGENVRYLTSGGLRAKTAYMKDFVQGLLALHAPLDAVLAYDLTNEVHFDASTPPLSLSSGRVTTANGQTYDMAKPDQKDSMVNDNLVYWIDQLRASVRQLDPTALVTVSFFVPQEPVPMRIGDVRFILTQAAIMRSEADFIDLHPYPDSGVTLAQYARNFGVGKDVPKPVIMGEFGASTSSYASANTAARALHDWQIESCRYGFDGWLLWTWDTEEERGFWNALSAGSAISQALAPANRPDPCQPGGFPEHNLALGRTARASRSAAESPPSSAVDGVTSNWWGAGDFAPQWIEIDLGVPSTIRLFRLVLSQSPAGETRHELWVGPTPAELYLLHTFEGRTSDQQVLEFTPDPPAQNVRLVRVVTTLSPSWVSWREIELLGP